MAKNRSSEKLILILQETKDLLSASQGTVWSSLSPQEIIHILDSNINLRQQGTCSRKDLESLFGPTGPIQDTAIDNKWGDEFLSISSKFDRAIN